jgi:hypothetical protein
VWKVLKGATLGLAIGALGLGLGAAANAHTGRATPFTGRATNADPYSTNHIACDHTKCSTLGSEDLPSFRAINDDLNLKKRASNISLYDALADVEARSVGEPESFWSRVTGKRPETYHQYVEHPVGKLELDFWGNMTKTERIEAAGYFNNRKSEISRAYENRGRVDTYLGAFNPKRVVHNVTTTPGLALRSKHRLEATAKFALRSFEATLRDQKYSLLVARLETGEFLYASGDATLRAESMAWFALAWMYDRHHKPEWVKVFDRMGYVDDPNKKESAYGELLLMNGRKAFEKSLESEDNISKIEAALDSLKYKYGVKLGTLEEEEHAKAKKALTGLRDELGPAPEGWPTGVGWPVIRDGRTVSVVYTRVKFPSGFVMRDETVVLAPLEPGEANNAETWVTMINKAAAGDAWGYWAQTQIAGEVTKWLASLNVTLDEIPYAPNEEG